MLRAFGTSALGAVLGLTLGFGLLVEPLHAEGKLDSIAAFKTGSSELTVATYTDPQANGTTKVGLLGIASPSRNSFAFKLSEWLAMIGLWNKAKVVSSASWKPVGTMSEKDTTDVSQLTISAGPGVSFVITSPKAGTVTYALAKSDAGRFEQAILKVKAYLSK